MSENIQLPSAIVVMGVSGCGKTTVGRQLARRLDVPFLDADDLHSQANRLKMAGATPLSDDDRAPWLAAVGRAIGEAGTGLVVACSALRRRYRESIAEAAGRPLVFAHLTGDEGIIHERMTVREHFMPPALLRSQLDALEPLARDERGRAFPVSDEPALIAARIQDWIVTLKEPRP